MSKLLKIGIVGCGAIGSSLAEVITRDFSAQAKVVALFDLERAKSRKLSRLLIRKDSLVVENLKQLIDRSDFVIEAASSKSSRRIAESVVRRRRDIMIMSVGGIISCFPGLALLAKRHNAKVFLPSGAIAGIDALKAAREGKIKRVTLTTRKHPRSFKGVRYVEGMKIRAITKTKVLFSGSAREAVKLFPQNINVAGILSIAGIHQDKTRVKIIADPSLKKNVHEIEIESVAGKIFTRTENILHPRNPKTSYLAVLSAVAMLRQILGPVKIGT